MTSPTKLPEDLETLTEFFDKFSLSYRPGGVFLAQDPWWFGYTDKQGVYRMGCGEAPQTAFTSALAYQPFRYEKPGPVEDLDLEDFL